jgi:hypothetical protein
MDRPVDEIADTHVQWVMRLFHLRRIIGSLFNGKTIPIVIQQIQNQARSRSLEG